jgi:hypothetical protein
MIRKRKPLTILAVVLRPPDGRTRCFGRGSFTNEDEKQRDVDGVRFDMGSERYRFELNKIKT